MPGGLPSSRSAGGTQCAPLGEGEAKLLGELGKTLRTDPGLVRRCQALSGVLQKLGLRQRARTCAVVGGSGVLAQRPRGSEIDRAGDPTRHPCARACLLARLLVLLAVLLACLLQLASLGAWRRLRAACAGRCRLPREQLPGGGLRAAGGPLDERPLPQLAPLAALG